jgi:hypothetical protein
MELYVWICMYGSVRIDLYVWIYIHGPICMELYVWSYMYEGLPYLSWLVAAGIKNEILPRH